MPVFVYQVDDGDFDATQGDDGNNFSSTGTELRAESNTVEASRFMAGIFIPQVPIASTDTLVECLVRVAPTTTSTDDANENIDFENTASASDFATTADIDGRTLTGSSVSWVSTSLGASLTDSPSLTTPFGVVLGGSWSEDNNICIVIKGKTTSDGNDDLRVVSFEGDSGLCPVFYMEFTEGAGTTPDIDTGLIRAAAPAGTGNQTYRDPNMSGTPNAAIIECNLAITDGTKALNVAQSLGITDGTTSLVVCAQAEDNQADTDTGRVGKTGSVILIVDQTGVDDGEATFVSFDADNGSGAGITLNWTNAPADLYFLKITLIKAENVSVDEVDPSDSVDGTVNTSISFQATMLFCIHDRRNYDDSFQNGADIGFGVCDADLNQGSIAWGSPNAVANPTPLYRIRDDAFANAASTGNDMWFEVTTIDATSYTITTRNGTQATQRLGVLAIDTGSIRTKVSSVEIPASSGNQSYTVGFISQIAGLLGGNGTTVNTLYSNTSTADNFSIGTFYVGTEYCSLIGEDPAADPTDTYSFNDNSAFILTTDAGVIDTTGTLDSFGSTTVVINWTDPPSSAVRGILWAIEEVQATSVSGSVIASVAGSVFGSFIGAGQVGLVTSPKEAFSKPSYEIWLTTDTGNRIAQLTTFNTFEASRVVNQIGSFNMTMPLSFNPSLIKPDRMVQFWRQPRGGRLKLWRVYFIRKWKFRTSQGVRSFEFGGPDILDLLRRRIVAAFAGSTQASKSDAADDMIKEIVSDSILDDVSVPTDAGTRVWDNLSIAADLALGPTLTRSFPFKKLLTSSGQGIIPLISKASREAGTEVFFDIVPDVISGSNASYILQTYTGQPGADLTSRMVFDEARGNMDDIEYEEDWTEEENYIYAAGQNQEADRNVQQVYDATRYSQSIWARSEGEADARNESDDNGVREAGRDALNTGRPKIRFTAIPLDVEGSRFMRDWDFGDRVRAKYLNIEFDTIIRAVTVGIDENGKETINARLDYES